MQEIKVPVFTALTPDEVEEILAWPREPWPQFRRPVAVDQRQQMIDVALERRRTQGYLIETQFRRMK